MDNHYFEVPKNVETLFWYNVLYTIGSYVIDTSNAIQHCSQYTDDVTQKKSSKCEKIMMKFLSEQRKFLNNFNSQENINNPLTISSNQIKFRYNRGIESKRGSNYFDHSEAITKLFCGYWILYIIAEVGDIKYTK